MDVMMIMERNEVFMNLRFNNYRFCYNKYILPGSDLNQCVRWGCNIANTS